MPKRTLLISSGIVLSLLFVCVGYYVLGLYKLYPLFSPPKGAILDWVIKFMSDPACQQPCWEGITPGKTHITDVSAIASQILRVTRVTLPVSVLGNSTQVDWYITSSTNEPDYWCSAYARDSKSVVSMVRLQI
jgi:hypothetical protein